MTMEPYASEHPSHVPHHNDQAFKAMIRLKFHIPLIFTFVMILCNFSQAESEHDPLADRALENTLFLLDQKALKAAKEQGETLHNLPDAAKERLVSLAVNSGRGELVTALIELGIEIEQRDARGFTPLMRALEAGNADAAHALKFRGADLTARNDAGQTVQELASIAGIAGFQLPLAQTLSLPVNDANALLLLYAELGDIIGVKTALDAGADPAVRAANGWSPLMLAALGSYLEVVTILADALDARTANGLNTDVDVTRRAIGLDPIQAALIGQGGEARNHLRVEETVKYIASRVYGGKVDNSLWGKFLKTARQLGYDDRLLHAAFRRSHVYIPPASLPAMHIPAWFLPELEYGLPTGIESDRAGWSKVQEVLQREGLYHGPFHGVADEATLNAIMAYMQPLIDILYSRSEEAATRATEEAETGHEPAPGPRYGVWRRESPKATYLGEMIYLLNKPPLPLGYTVENRSGNPGTFAFYGFRGSLDSPLCELFDMQSDGTSWIMSCRLLDGHVIFTDSHERFSIDFMRGDQRVAHAVVLKAESR